MRVSDLFLGMSLVAQGPYFPMPERAPILDHMESQCYKYGSVLRGRRTVGVFLQRGHADGNVFLLERTAYV